MVVVGPAGAVVAGVSPLGWSAFGFAVSVEPWPPDPEPPPTLGLRTAPVADGEPLV